MAAVANGWLALLADEEERFAAAIPQEQRDAALALLRTLLHIDPAQRPRHALQISRMLHAIQGVKPVRGTFDAVDPVLAMRRPSALNGWQAMRAA